MENNVRQFEVYLKDNKHMDSIKIEGEEIVSRDGCIMIGKGTADIKTLGYKYIIPIGSVLYVRENIRQS